MPSGYYRFPTLREDTVVFTCEDDLWTVSAAGGVARRLTSGLGEASRPLLSPDGEWLGFAGREDGQTEVYRMPAQGGQPKRLTYLGGTLCYPAGWTPDGQIVFANNARQFHQSMLHLYSISPQGGIPELVNVGPARSIAFGPGGTLVLGRNTGDPARWKRYHGGTAGTLWIDESGSGQFHPLIDLKGNLASPMWVGERVYFLSDHEGVGNLYSCNPDGSDLRRHTNHGDYYARNASSDGRRIVYHAGADLYLFDPASGVSNQIQIEFHSPQTQRSRKFVDPSRYMESYNLHPKGQALALVTRGKLFSFANWEGAVLQHGESQDKDQNGIRFRVPVWLNDGKRLLAVSDEGGEERFILYSADGLKAPETLPELDSGRVVSIEANPKKEQVAFNNHRNELVVLDLETKELKIIDRGRNDRIRGFSWSPDGEWLAYSVNISMQTSVLKLWQSASGQITPLTQPVLHDVAPSFDPDGRYLYFLSYRTFDPVYDNLQFDLNFPCGVKPYLILLKKDSVSPFTPQPRQEEEKKDEKAEDKKPEGNSTEDAEAESTGESSGETPTSDEKKDEKKNGKPVQIDLEGIQQRIVAFPVDEGRYGQVKGVQGDKVFYSMYPVEGALGQDFFSTEPPAKGALWVYNFADQKEEMLFRQVTDFDVTADGVYLVYQSGYRLRVVKVSEKPEDNNGRTRKTGWIDLGRLRVAVTPGTEWRQMFREAWRLQRDQFWTPDMSKVDWLAIHNRYLPLVDRVSSRGEFSDLMWEMQGELSTSHCYEFGGDYRPQPVYPLGSLAASYVFDEAAGGWRITEIARGDAWDPKRDSPLNTPGVNIQVGDVILAVNGQRLGVDFSPEMALVNLADTEINLTLANAQPSPEGEAKPEQASLPARNVTVKTLGSEFPVRYRQWVEANRAKVHAATDGKVGYVHIPDMGAAGYAEFHRYFLAEIDRDGLIVDVRFNGGGHVSALILQKLARKRIGYDTMRWGEDPQPYPPESVLGPLVALTNEQAGSDGDIFSHGFKMMGLGPLLGKRTWGGVIGIWPRHTLVDGSITTQPEFSFWFNDVGWGVENYGTDPDIEVDNLPQDYARGVDVQLERAIEEAVKLLETNPPKRPDFSNRPDLSLPKLS
jgi:tricorn protease